MKSILITSLILLTVLARGAVAGQPTLWNPHDRYVQAVESSPWDGDDSLELIEYRIKYLLQTDRIAAEIEKDPKTRTDTAVEVHSMADYLEEALETCYHEATPHLKSKPHPYLLSMMLYHYGKYHTGSAMERFSRTNDDLRKLDPMVTEHVDSLLKKGEGG